ncbi:MAG: TIGR04255 family protein [Archangium sp.]
MRARLAKLDAPPITEVVCGAFFAPIPELDPVFLGAYWESIRAEFPQRELKVALAPFDVSAFSFNTSQDIGPVRTWFVSRDDIFIVQVQHDRFYLNWRMRGAAYPRFSNGDETEGLLSRFLGHFDRFASFCRTSLGASPSLSGLELAKIDQLREGQHFKDAADLASLAPMLKPVVMTTGSLPNITMRVSAPVADGSTDISWDSLTSLGPTPSRALKLECRRTVRRSIDAGSLKSEFEAANLEVNELFRSIIPEDQLYRFMKGANE